MCPGFSFAGRSITHGHGLFSPSRKRKSVESKSGRVESSTSAQPERETSPGSMGSCVLLPRAPSRVRVVPIRFSGSVSPGMPDDLLAVDRERDGEVVAD